MKRFGLVAITALFALLGVARTNAQQVTVNVNMNGQPASGVSVVFIAANLIKTPQAQPNAQPAEGNANFRSMFARPLKYARPPPNARMCCKDWRKGKQRLRRRGVRARRAGDCT